MPRVTSSEVKGLINTSFDVDPMIATASLLVDEALVGQGLTAVRLKTIELWLSAHFVAVAEERGALTGSKKGDSDETYFIKVGAGLNMTRFGQQAVALDTSGILLEQSTTTLKAQFRVV
jgi:hypothetical protein